MLLQSVHCGILSLLPEELVRKFEYNSCLSEFVSQNSFLFKLVSFFFNVLQKNEKEKLPFRKFLVVVSFFML